MLFREIAGQDTIKKHLVKSVKEGRVAHAMLFTGPEGCGNLAMAIAFAQYINCLDKGEDDACGLCPSCVKIKKFVHPDLHFVFPVATVRNISKPISDDFIKEWREATVPNPYISLNEWYTAMGVENKQGVIGAEESENVIKKLGLKTFEAEYKIVIIWMADKMNPSFSNKILKILEEPSDKTLFILVSESSDGILPTIFSRTQLIRFSKLSKKEIEKALSGIDIAPGTDIQRVAHLANGNYNMALKLAAQEDENRELRENFIQLMRICYTKDVLKLVPWVDTISSSGREGLKAFFIYSLHLLRQNYIMGYKIDDIVFVDANEEGFVNNFHIFINDSNVDQLSAALNDACSHIEHNAYSKIVLLDMGLKMFGLINPRNKQQKNN